MSTSVVPPPNELTPDPNKRKTPSDRTWRLKNYYLLLERQRTKLVK
jgi:hypothetical protein